MIIGIVSILIHDLLMIVKSCLFGTPLRTHKKFAGCGLLVLFLAYLSFYPKVTESWRQSSASDIVTPQVASVCITLASSPPHSRLPLCFLIRVSLEIVGKRVTLWRIWLGGQKFKLTPWDTFSLIYPPQTFHPVFLHSHLSLCVGAKLRV